MADDPDQQRASRDLKALDERITEARNRSASNRPAPQASGLGVGLKMATEFVAAVMVGVGIGWVLDAWLHTRPAFLLGFFVIGVAAGFMNLYRYAQAANRQNGP